MGRGETQAAWTSLDTLLTLGTLGSCTDGQLLDHFRRSRDSSGQEAFRILVERHGAMVLGVCRALVRDPHEAEDAFQATFLVLVRRCESIRNRESIAPWLYGVACRVARRAQSRSARRRKREIAADVDPPARAGSDLESSATDQALQEEIRRLPDLLRAPLILCCLEGQSYELAACRLGLRESTLRGRLHRARQRLERQLRRRGILSPVVAKLFEPGRLVLPPLASSLLESTTQFAVRWSTLSGLLVGATAVPESIAALAQGVIHAMLLQTVKVCGIAAILTVGTVGAVVVAQKKSGSDGPATEATATNPPRQKEAGTPANSREEAPRIDLGRQTRRILQALQEKYDLDLPPEPTPTSPGPYLTLHQLLKAIKKATTRPDFSGIPIYVDPLGLQEAGVSLVSPVTDISRNGTLGFVLRQSLRQLHLSYVVKDGFLMISSQADITIQRLDELDQKVNRLLTAIERLEEARKDEPAERRK